MNNEMKYILFSSPFCVACRPVKEFLNRSDLRGQQVNASDDDGSDLAIKFSVTTLPTIILLDDKDQEIGRCHSVNEIKEILG